MKDFIILVLAIFLILCMLAGTEKCFKPDEPYKPAFNVAEVQ